MSGMYTGFVMRIGLKQTTTSYPFVYGCLEASIGDKWIEWYNDSRTNPIPEVWGFAYMFSHLVLDGIMVDFTMPESMRPAQCLEGMFFGSQLDFSNFNDPNSSLGFSNSLIGGKLATKHCEAMFGQRTESRY